MKLLIENSLAQLYAQTTTPQGVPELHWLNMPESWAVFILIAIVLLVAAAVIWLYLTEINTCPIPVKILLAVLRFTVVFLLILMLLKPSISYKQTDSFKHNIVFLRDASLSFARKDNYKDIKLAQRVAKATGWDVKDIQDGKYSRAEILTRALELNEQEIVKSMRQKGSIRVVDFSEVVDNVALIPATSDRDKNNESPKPETNTTENSADDLVQDPDKLETGSIPPLVANGRGTDLWQGLREILGDTNRLSAIVIAGDGQHNGPEDVLSLLRDESSKKNIPIFTVGVGDPSRPRNLSVTDVYVREKAQPNEQFEIEALLYAEDVQQSQVDVELIQHQIGSDGNSTGEQVVDTAAVNVPANGGRMRVDFSHVVAVPGKYTYTIKVQEVESESETSDNSMVSSEVEVIDEKVKVLLIAGSPTWEYRMVQRLLQRDGAISLSCWLQTMDEDRSQEGNEPIAELPRTIEQLGQYNVIMMFDPNPNEFDEQFVESIQTFCKRKAGGVMYMAGPKFTNMFMTLNRLKKFRNMMPVKFGDDNFFAAAEADLLTSNVQQRPGRMLVVKHNLDHPIMSFSKDLAINESLWAKMPSIFWSYPTMSAKPAARTLMERGDNVSEQGNQPLLVVGRYGAGNVVYMGFNGTWRWRRVGLQAQYFDRFWIQVVRFLVETRSLQGSRRGMIDPDRTAYELGDKITLIAQILDEQFNPLAAESVSAVIRSEDGRTQNIELRALPGQEGNFEASLVAQRTGNFQVFVNLPGAEGNSGIEPVSYRVEPPSVEAQSYWLNEKLLREISDSTERGKYYNIDELKELVANLPLGKTTTEFDSPPQPLWDTYPWLRWLTFLALFLLLTSEWAVRKVYRLL